MATYRFTVDGKRVSVDAQPEMPLLYALRDDLIALGPQAVVDALAQYKRLGLGHILVEFRRDDLSRMVEILDLLTTDIRPAVEARWCGCVLVADGLELILVEPWQSELPDDVRNDLAANAGTIIALLRGESRVRTGKAKP